MSRNAAWHYIKPRIQAGWRVLDLGARDCPFTEHMLANGCEVTALDVEAPRMLAAHERLDKRFQAIVADVREINFKPRFDCVLAVYSLQHMIGYEPAIWCKVREWLKPDGVLIGMARYQANAPQYEGNRDDPLFGHSISTLTALATLSGFQLTDYQLYEYSGMEFVPCKDSGRSNAIGFTARRVL